MDNSFESMIFRNLLEVGDRVICPYNGGDITYLATVTAVRDESCSVIFDDGETVDDNVTYTRIWLTTIPFNLNQHIFDTTPAPTQRLEYQICYYCHVGSDQFYRGPVDPKPLCKLCINSHEFRMPRGVPHEPYDWISQIDREEIEMDDEEVVYLCTVSAPNKE